MYHFESIHSQMNFLGAPLMAPVSFPASVDLVGLRLASPLELQSAAPVGLVLQLAQEAFLRSARSGTLSVYDLQSSSSTQPFFSSLS